MQDDMVSFRQPTSDVKPQAEAQRIHTLWNDALAARDVDEYGVRTLTIGSHRR